MGKKLKKLAKVATAAGAAYLASKHLGKGYKNVHETGAVSKTPGRWKNLKYAKVPKMQNAIKSNAETSGQGARPQSQGGRGGIAIAGTLTEDHLAGRWHRIRNHYCQHKQNPYADRRINYVCVYLSA